MVLKVLQRPFSVQKRMAVELIISNRNAYHVLKFSACTTITSVLLTVFCTKQKKTLQITLSIC